MTSKLLAAVAASIVLLASCVDPEVVTDETNNVSSLRYSYQESDFLLPNDDILHIFHSVRLGNDGDAAICGYYVTSPGSEQIAQPYLRNFILVVNGRQLPADISEFQRFDKNMSIPIGGDVCAPTGESFDYDDCTAPAAAVCGGLPAVNFEVLLPPQ
jgi:hypothetical protein